MSGDGELILERFLPYRLSVLANRVSQALARLYRDRFGLSVTEWRVIAVLARHPGLSASALAERTAMDKVAVSRAVASLAAAGRVLRGVDRGDRRRSRLRLSPRGRAIYAAVAPQALAFERALLAALERSDRAALDRALARLAGTDLEALAEAAAEPGALSAPRASAG
ncbi:MAG: MarR family winged helix-turn-helix transcriptional regulator [Xanthomonadales bacterium]|nr:MarR family winged helix-turn-helix transcriptional regulator [Xanthomonadales bacterium]